jgi:hypothetical protein
LACSLIICDKSVKNTKNNKTPGLDGFTSEFYKIFWNDVYIYFVRSLNTDGEVGHLSISQRQGVISYILKEDISKSYSTVSNAFSKSRSNRIPGIFSSSALSIRSKISLVHSPM